jgi:deoxyribodipyrimidine photo-lyase
MTKIKQTVSIFWFRRDLRFEDNHALFEATKSETQVLPLFIFDTDILSQLEDKNDRRVDFVYQALTDLQNKLLPLGRSLCIRTGKPLDIFKTLLEEYDVKAVYTNSDYEQSAIARDKEIETFLSTNSIRFLSFKDQVIFEWNEVLKANGEPYTIFTPYSKVWKQKLSENELLPYPSEDFISKFSPTEQPTFPSLSDIGFNKTDMVFSTPILDKNIIANYENTRNIPAIEGTTRLSIHLRSGTVSIRKVVACALETNEQWLNELIWREFFMSILVHFPHVETGAFRKKYEAIAWRNNEKEFEAWCEGKTGYPIVDAGMRQLNETGWMHNRVRMIVASFLTKHLLIDWRWGEAYFANKLIDYELSSNNGNWQWAAGCGCDAAPYFRVFNPTEQTKRFDPELKYIRKWVKEFDTFDYPQPIVEHSFARNRALEAYKNGIN